MKRRLFLKHISAAGTGVILIPTIVPSSVFGKNAPSNKINIGQIGCGRIARTHDMVETLNLDSARFVAVCDLDCNRVKDGKKLVEDFYHKKTGSRNYVDVKMYEDYKEMLMESDIDAVIISTPDHWHAQLAIEAALKGKDIYMQKPNSLSVVEGRLLSDVVNRQGVILQVGTQVRSSQPQFRRAAELVRNGRIGKLHTVKLSFPGDPSGPDFKEMPVPANLNYDMWLGSTPEVPYSEMGVHPQKGYDRPGWLRREQFGAGMITGWGQHQFDLANWAMDTEYTGPLSVEAVANFPKSGLWDVHGDFMVKMEYANDLTVYANSETPVVIRYEGTEGWIEVFRGNIAVTNSDPVSPQAREVLNASDPKILTSEIKDNEIHLYKSDDHHKNWLDCIKTREQPITPVEVGHRACSVCLVSYIAMKLDRKLYWDPEKERFKNDDEANSMLSRSQRYPYGTNYIQL
uniref:Gfo/Idh/MocA family protein n=1 Tax=uncultured Draconibacterium sp. TaxID=1573823 RepID=UPI003216FFEF